MGSLRIRLTARVCGAEENVRALRDVLESTARLAGFDETDAGEIVLAVHEALVNVVRHGYGGDCGGRVVVRVRAGRDEMEILIVDACSPVESDRIRPRAWDDGKPGGMGVPIMRRVFDVVEHRPRVGRGNVLRLHRRRRPEESEC